MAPTPAQAGGYTHLRAEHLKHWRREAYPGDQSPPPPQGRELWACLVDLAQNMWRMGEIPRELRWMILVLIPKGTTDTRGIILLETLWKLVEALINTRLKTSLQMHDVLHGFRYGRWTGTAIMELKLAQELARIDHEPLFQEYQEEGVMVYTGKLLGDLQLHYSRPCPSSGPEPMEDDVHI